MTDGALAFVVQKHKATALHYDFRLEIGGMMASWAIPKGPTLDPTLKRLAMPTDLHELEYRHFEGVLPDSEIGKGVVMIWDQGNYAPELEAQKGVFLEANGRADAEEVAHAGLRDGNLKFRLYGQKLGGSFALVKTKGLGGAKEAWLLIKHKDRFCQQGYNANDHDFSAVTSRTLAQIGADGTVARSPM
ncbi:MAG: 3'-phosphoesterase [Nitrososphaerota archaeon]|nr:3'-phosphoesterase [Nitrososphaerota archaeon]